MSSNLRAEPVDRNKKNLSTSLKFILRKRYEEPINTLIDVNEIPYLTGIADANDSLAEEVKSLIQMIEKYGKISLKEEY